VDQQEIYRTAARVMLAQRGGRHAARSWYGVRPYVQFGGVA
jgi:hypothetical protein